MDFLWLAAAIVFFGGSAYWVRRLEKLRSED